jgi:hypothetical protein
VSLRPSIVLSCALLSLAALPANAQAQEDSLQDAPAELIRVKQRLSNLHIEKFVTITNLKKSKEASASEGATVEFSYKVPFDPGMQDQMESNYAKLNGQSYWTKILMVMSDVIDAPVASIHGTGPGTMGCRTSHVGMYRGLISRGEGGCMSAVYFFGLKLPDSGRSLASDGKTTKTSAFSANDLEDALMQHFKAFGGISVVRERSDYHRVFTIWGMRNVILKGENVWEKVNVLATIAQRGNNDDTYQHTTPYHENSYRIVLSSDGYLASGMGAAPPITSYDTSMEPKYFKYLDDFNHGLALYLSEQ